MCWPTSARSPSIPSILVGMAPPYPDRLARWQAEGARVAPIPKELGLTQEELDELMTSSWNMRVATVGPGDRMNVTPLWFGWAGGRIYFYCRGQKIANLRRNPACTVLVDRNERFPELQGAMFQGRATVLEDAAAEEADPHLEEVRWQM